MAPHLSLAASVIGQGILTWAIPLGVLICVLAWYALLVRGRDPE
jgi:hypothetical protein